MDAPVSTSPLKRKLDQITLSGESNDPEEQEEGVKRSNRGLDGKKRGWGASEAELLRALVDQHGHDWSLVAENMPGRVSKQCRERYLNHMAPGLRKGVLDEAEQAKFNVLHGELGNRWTEIAKHMEGRSDNSLKNFYFSQQRSKRSRLNHSSQIKSSSSSSSSSSSRSSSSGELMLGRALDQGTAAALMHASDSPSTGSPSSADLDALAQEDAADEEHAKTTESDGSASDSDGSQVQEREQADTPRNLFRVLRGESEPRSPSATPRAAPVAPSSSSTPDRKMDVNSSEASVGKIEGGEVGLTVSASSALAPSSTSPSPSPSAASRGRNTRSTRSGLHRSASASMGGDTPGKKRTLTLPEGWNMVQRVSEKCKYKTYLSPEGKSFRSLAGVYRYIEQVQNGEVPIKGSRRPRGPYGQQNRHSSTTSISSSTTSSSSSSSSSVVSLRKNGGATSSGYGDALLTSASSMPYGYNATANAQGYLFHDTGHVTTDQNQRLGCVHTGHVYETDRHESLLQFLSQILRPDMQKTDSNRLARLLELQAANTDPAEKTMVFTHAACFGHRPCNGSLESPDRVKRALVAIADSKLQRVDWQSCPRSVDIADMKAVHSDEYLDSLFTLFDVVNRGTMPHVVLDPPFHDTIISPGTREAVLFSAGCVTAAVDAVVNGDTRNAFCAVRPPGHHAEVKRAMGFCFLNNVAIGASYAKRIHKMHRVAVVDFDAHHGNGTQEMLGMDADSFLFVSLHRNDVFPFNATSTFTTVPKNAQNHPVFDRAGFLGAIKHIKESLTAFDPDLIFISAGFAGHAEDCQAHSQGLCSDDYVKMTDMIKEVAADTCSGRIVSVLEGGYNPEALAVCVVDHVHALTKIDLDSDFVDFQ